MDIAVIRVGLGQPRLVPEKSAKAVIGAQFKFSVHLDGFKRADFDASLATHTDRNINIEDCWVKLQFTNCVRLFILAFFDIDALGRAFLLTDLAAYTTHSGLPIVAIIDKKRK